jgi:hypothetical protein
VSAFTELYRASEIARLRAGIAQIEVSSEEEARRASYDGRDHRAADVARWRRSLAQMEEWDGVVRFYARKHSSGQLSVKMEPPIVPYDGLLVVPLAGYEEPPNSPVYGLNYVGNELAPERVLAAALARRAVLVASPKMGDSADRYDALIDLLRGELS